MENLRELALEILLLVEKGEGFDGKIIKQVLDKYDYLDRKEKAFLKRLAEGTIERQIELDYHLNAFSKTPVKKMKPFIRNLLRMSAYQILYMDSVPDSAACNEAVKLAEMRRFGNLKGFVNGVLRNLSRNKEKLEFPDREKEPVCFLSVRYSMPEWIVRMWTDTYGMEDTEKILAALIKERAVSFRISLKLGDEGKRNLLEMLENQGVELSKNPYLDYVYEAQNTENIAKLPGFAQGDFTVQDVSSCLCIEAAGVRTSDLVMDLCAAPGGKTVLAAEKAKRVLSFDVSEEKTALIRENAERMKVSEKVEIAQHDATVPDEGLKEKADILILDVPCSGLGVIGKKRDIKYRVTEDGQESLVELQKKIVSNSWQCVKPGGTLIYSTCTINREENQKMAEWIVRNFPFEPVNVKETLPAKLLEELADPKLCGENWVQLLPGFVRADGFFFAKFVRKPGTD